MKEENINSRAYSAYISIFISILSFVALFICMPREFGIFDEGIITSSASLMLAGKLVHRDFFSVYGPGQYAVVAALYKVFGSGFMVPRLYDLLVRSIVIGTVYFTVSIFNKPTVSIFYTIVVGLWMISSGNYLYPVFPCILITILGSHILSGILASNQFSLRLGICGALTGIAALIRYDVGFILMVSHLAAIALVICFRQDLPQKWRLTLRSTAIYIVGVTVVFLPVAIYFVSTSPIRPFIEDVVDYATKIYPQMRGWPFPGLSVLRTNPYDLAVYLPMLTIALMAVEVFRPASARPKFVESLATRDRPSIYLVVFGILTVALFFKGIVRISALQMLLSIVPSIVVLSILAGLWWNRGKVARAATVAMALLALAPAVLDAKQWFGQSLHTPDRTIAGWMAVRAGVVKAPVAFRERCQYGPASGIAWFSEDYARAASYLGAHSREGEKILVGLNRHDRIFINPIGLYFASGRLPATHWFEFEPGLQTRADIQNDMVAELARERVRWVVRDATTDGVREPNGSSRSSGVRILDRYLDANYRPVAASGKVIIWLINGETAPTVSASARCEASPIVQSVSKAL